MNAVPISSNYGKVVDVVDYGTSNQQNLSEERQHGGRTVVVSAQPSGSAFPGTRPPSYSDVMAQDQRNRRSAAVLRLVLTEANRLSSESRNRPEKGCCESLCENGTCGDIIGCCCLVVCAIPLWFFKQ